MANTCSVNYMRKNGVAIVCLLAFVLFAAAQRGHNGSLRVVANSTNSYAVELSLASNEFALHTVDDFTAIDAGYGFSLSQDVGKPALPVFQQIIAVPIGAEPKLEFSGEYVVSRNLDKPLLPVQPHQFKNRNTEFVIDTALYHSATAYQKPLAQLIELGIMRGLRLYRLTVSPFYYYAQNNVLLNYTNVYVVVSFAGADEDATRSEILRNGGLPPVSFANKAAFKNLLSQNTALPPKYVMVAQDTFAAALRPFVQWKRQKGFNVVELYTHGCDSCSQIRLRLDSIYRAATPLDPAPAYLLIVGDVEHVPAFGGKVRITGLPAHSTDLYYAEYTGDFYPEVPYGRLSVADTAELSAVVKKILAYEQCTFSDASFLNRVTLVAGREGRTPAPIVTNGQINYLKNNYLSHSASVDTHLFYNPASEFQLPQIVESLDSGASLVNYTSHCLSTGWYHPSFTTDGADTLGNVGKYFFAVNNCCLSSRFFENRCFGEALLRNPDAGAVGVIGSSNETLWEEDYYWALGAKGPVSLNAQYNPDKLGTFDRWLHTHGEPVSAFAPTAGEMLLAGGFGLAQMGMAYENYYWEIYNLLGDPSLMPYFGVPQPVVVAYGDSLPVGATHLSISGTPLARVAFVQDCQLLSSVLLDSNGMAEVDFSHPLTGSPLLLTATAQFCKPFVDTVATYISSNPQIAVADSRVADVSGVEAANGRLEAGVTYIYNFCIKNYGADTAKNISLTLSSLDGRCSVSSLNYTRPVLLAGDTVCANGLFAFVPDSSLADGSTVSLEAMLTSNNGDTCFSCQHFVVLSSKVETGSISVFHNGQPANRLAHGGTYTLEVPVVNRGSEVSDSIMVYARVNPSHGTLALPDTLVLAPLQVHGSHTVEFVFSVGPAALSHIDIAVGTVHRGVVGESLLRLPLGTATETFESGDFASYPWDTTHPNHWIIDSLSSNAHAGHYSARSAEIDHKQRSVLSITLATIADDSITFWRRTSTEAGSDYLSFFVDGTLQGRWAGSGHYERMAFFVPSGKHQFSWVYEKDGSLAGGSDCVWIDDVSFPLSVMDTACRPSAPAGLTEVGQQGMCKIYPNPANGFVMVENTRNESFVVSLMEPLGQIVDKKMILPFGKIYYSTAHLRCGIYILRFESKNDCFIQKLIISR